MTRDPSWQNHAASFNNSWRQLEAQRLSKIRAWSASHINDRAGMPLYYMFSGPDFLYANAFYPDASTYILSGLEPVGRIPVINDYTRRALGSLRSSMASSISLSFFITKNMKHQLRETALSGTLPILMVYIARAGKTIDDINLISLSPDGTVAPVESGAPQRGVQGVRITFHSTGKPKQTLYYFSTDVSDSGVKNSGFLTFVGSFGRGDALFKAASYLPHSGGFSQVRDFIIGKADHVVQDDSGIPVVYFKPDQWALHPFGRYLGPIALFPGRHQNQLAEIYRRRAEQADRLGHGLSLADQRIQCPARGPKGYCAPGAIASGDLGDTCGEAATGRSRGTVRSGFGRDSGADDNRDHASCRCTYRKAGGACESRSGGRACGGSAACSSGRDAGQARATDRRRAAIDILAIATRAWMCRMPVA